MLDYDVEAHVGGKIAQFGARLIDGVAKKMADQFFTNFAAAVGGRRRLRMRALDGDRPFVTCRVGRRPARQPNSRQGRFLQFA